ncbi:sensor histidine kinase [Lysobacter enzymogenes]|uniref:histidine kinase n=1 Tax=Lysobacter enzymogenes TaxID=69 RepID=A0AAU9AS83_LYSEN|nr:HAMP domain-containing sensor histidine kinase [Lysobacter enzymogenes]BAW00010.1 integral membrane sensor signal transduction histidine kinase [Lysobacter enzymogenes]
MSKRPSLRRSLLIAIALYTGILSAVVASHGYWVNERAEQAVWESMLHAEMQHVVGRRVHEAEYTGPDTDALRYYDGAGFAASPFAALAAGVHDEVRAGSREYVVLVEDVAGGRRALALDITDQEQGERTLGASLALSVVLVAALMAALAYWGVGRLVAPLSRLAALIARLPPDGRGPALEVSDTAPAEIAVVTDSVNRYMGRIREHMERERTFINLASHELRTPIAVIAGSAEVALAHPHMSEGLRPHVLRTQRTAAAMEELASMLLALARDPERALRGLAPVDLAAELPRIVDDFAYVARDKELTISIDAGPLPQVGAPAQVLRAVIGNLIRNAIENSDRGSIRIHAPDRDSLVVQDSGHGMSAAEIAALHARLAMSEYASTGGLGLGLIARICDHYGWTLQLSAAPQGGTCASIRFAQATPH